MRRDDQAQSFSLGTRSRRAAIGCVLLWAAGCRFSTSAGEGGAVPEPDGGRASSEAVLPHNAGVTTPAIMPVDAGSVRETEMASSDAGHAQGQRSAQAPALGTMSTAVTMTTRASPPTDAAAASDDAGSQGPADAGVSATASADEVQCSADLASCLLLDPLGYAACLRMQEEQGCPTTDAGVATSSPVTTEAGQPLSQACQAELASCIMRLPTPENAASCTEKARKCK